MQSLLTLDSPFSHHARIHATLEASVLMPTVRFDGKVPLGLGLLDCETLISESLITVLVP